MLGRDHALLGAVATLGLGAPVARLVGHPLPPAQLAAAAAVGSAFALLPDIDEPGSSVSRKFGLVSEAVSHATKTLAGGHREATHSLAFAAGVGALAWWCERYSLFAPILLYLSLALVLRMLVPAGLARQGSLVALVAPVAAGWAMWRYEAGGWLARAQGFHHIWWLPFIAAGGVLLHLVGDSLTASGVPFLWPWKRNFAIPLVGHTDSLREHLLGAALSLGLVALAWVEVASPLLRAGLLIGGA